MLSKFKEFIVNNIAGIIAGHGITLTNNEIEDIKVIRSLESRGILLKGTTEKVINQKRGFLGLLIKFCLLLVKRYLKGKS